MRSHRPVRARPRHAALGALVLAGTLSATALATAEPAPSPGAAPAVRAARPHQRGPAASHRRSRPCRLVVIRRHYDVHAGSTVRVRGTLLPRGRGRRVVVEAAVRGRWRALAAARTRANGHFAVRIVAVRLGTLRLRVRFAGDRASRAGRAGAGTLRAYRPTLASWYALYGGALACGGRLGYGTLGVANRTLPCGTRVTLRYRGRTVTVPVIDRGPYVGGREWDLTGATARRLGFGGVGVVWSTR